ncbi:MAG: tRNA (guanine-N(1)-)-methyltransferase [candidate division WS2 bacterium]|nr:tRNA (guanine-N(1)-)-methyltransferase [Candidatus Lithacetigena glycinireducens]MBT9174606.1 tRNA (guanine-N(1)-)-methyltransferase [Candidatus Lithacetigena glycinireducens]
MRIDIITAFPEYFYSPLEVGIIRKALEEELLKVELHNLRNFSSDKHGKIDDYPYSGKPGMIIKAPIVLEAVNNVQNLLPYTPKVVLFTSTGVKLNNSIARNLSEKDGLILICGHYEGIDERVKEHFSPLEISIGDYIISGGEAAALVLIEAIIRFLPAVIKRESYEEESFENNLLEYPQYTRPPEFAGMEVPEILLSGNHQDVSKWLLKESLKRTLLLRPDLIKNRYFSKSELDIIDIIFKEFVELVNCIPKGGNDFE